MRMPREYKKLVMPPAQQAPGDVPVTMMRSRHDSTPFRFAAQRSVKAAVALLASCCPQGDIV